MLILFWVSLTLLVYSYFIYPLILRLCVKPKDIPTVSLETYPSVDIIIAAYNEESCIKERIENALAQDYQGNFQVLVASDGSQDRTGEIIESFKDVRVKAYSTFSGVSLTGSYTEGSSGPTPIDSTTSNISVAKNAWKRYTVNLGSGYSNLSVTMSGGSGDADLYVRRGSQSTTSAYDCRPYKNGNNEVCTFSSPASGTWHIDIRGYSAASGVSFRVQAD